MLFDQAANNWRQSGPTFFQNQSEIDRSMVNALSQCLLLLRNLNAARYHCDGGWTPARFRKVPQKLSPDILFRTGDFDEAGLSCFLGLYILVEAMLEINVQPKCLDLAVQFGDPHWFIGFPSCEKIKQISRNVKNLRLRHHTFGIHSNSDLLSGSEVRVPITAANFPKLQHFTLEERYCFEYLRPHSGLAPP